MDFLAAVCIKDSKETTYYKKLTLDMKSIMKTLLTDQSIDTGYYYFGVVVESNKNIITLKI